MQNLQQFFNSQQQPPPTNPTTTLSPLPIPQLVAQASTPIVLPSNASNRSNTPSISNLQIQGTENVLNAVSASLVYAGANKNGSQNITPATSKPASVIGDGEREAIAVPHSYFVSNISIPDIGIIDEEGFLSIVGRSKDMIIRAGENISPFEIESFYDKKKWVRDI